MARIAGVRFTKAGPLLLAGVDNEMDVCLGARVVVETSKGLEVGTVATLGQTQEGAETKGSVVRAATPEDTEQEARLLQRSVEAIPKAQAKIAEHQLPMQVLNAQWTLDGGYLTITFWAEDRVDFRELVRDLARMFKARIELHQVGTRERAKLRGGLGRCGRLLCCNLWLAQPPQVTVQMAREQALLQSMPELTGMCGRLLCCLRFEYQDYLTGKAELPPPGEHVVTPSGAGTVVKRDLMRGRVTVQMGEREYLDFGAKEVSALQAETACADCDEAPGAGPK